MRTVRFTALALLATVVSVAPGDAAVICRNKKSGRLAVRDTTCTKKEAALDLSQFGAVGPKGDPGDPGPPGADGQLRIYGDGSNGAKTFSAGGSIGGPEDAQFTNVTITSPVGVDDGGVIRCTGNLTITASGSLFVGQGASGGYTDNTVDPDRVTYPYQPPHPGWSPRFATNGGTTTNFGAAPGGIGGNAIDFGPARWLLRPGIFGGSGGGHSAGGAGGPAGGSVVVLVAGTFTNDGLIGSDGASGSGNAGGGGGGIIVIASRTAIVNNGTIRARGGNSQNVSGANGSGGGGGGGIVHLLAPAVTQGTIDVAGGPAGTVGGSVSASSHVGGGGGGGCGGNGGYGGGMPAGNPATPTKGNDGSPGLALVDQVDPTALF